MNPRFPLIAILGALLAIAAMWWLQPDTGVVPPPPVADGAGAAPARLPAPDAPHPFGDLAASGWGQATEDAPEADPVDRPRARTLGDLQGAGVPPDGPLPLTEAGLQSLYQQHEAPLRLCERWFPPDGGDDVAVQLIVGRTGRGPAYVRDAEVPGAPDSPLGPCIVSALRHATFDGPPGAEETTLAWSLPRSRD